MIEPAYRYRATAVRVVDGDTFVADVDLGFRVHHHTMIRLVGWDAPEKGTPDWSVWRDRLVSLVEPLVGLPLVVESQRDKQSFARWLCRVWLPDGREVSQVLTEMRDSG